MFEARQRTAVDGKTWWAVFDTEKQKYSTLLCFGKYKTKRECEIAIMQPYSQKKYLKLCISNAKKIALTRDGYNQVIIQDKDGNYSFSREYPGCCPEWYGKIIGKVITYWEMGILKCRYEVSGCQ